MVGQVKKPKKSGWFGLLVATLFLLLLVAAVFVAEDVTYVFLYVYLGLSAITFVLYAWDKSAAKKSRRRVPEKHLHFFALCGGWPGALYAQYWLRHKSIKTSFKWRCWLTVILNVAMLALIRTVYLADYADTTFWAAVTT